MEFKYKAVDKNGKLVEGKLTAVDKNDALVQIEKKNLTPLVVSKSKQRLYLLNFWFKKSFSRKDMIIFIQSLASLIEAGVSLDRALQITKSVLQKSNFSKIIDELLADIKSGKSLAKSLHRQKVFPEICVSMIKAGEVSGVLGTTLASLARYLEQSYEFKTNLLSSLIYPVLLLSVSILSLIVLIVFVVPRFINMFETMDIQAPITILIASYLGCFIRSYWWVILIFLSGLLYYFKYRLSKIDGKSWKDNKLLKIPILGKMIIKIENAKFARTLGTLLKSGVPILGALSITKEIISNELFKLDVERLYIGIREGDKFANLFNQDKSLWHPVLTSLASIGEETGQFANMLLKCAQMLEKDIEEELKKIVSLIEPSTIIIMGLLVGTLIVSMLTAVFSINETVF